MIAEALLWYTLSFAREFKAFERRVRRWLDRCGPGMMMSTPAVRPIIALTYASAIDDPGRFKSSKQVGARFGLTPRRSIR